MPPDEFESGGEAALGSDENSVQAFYWAEFMPRFYDPHKDGYNFRVDNFIVFWYSADDALISSGEAAAASAISRSYADDVYRFTCDLILTKPDGAEKCAFQLNITDTSTGKTYTTTTYRIDIE